MRYALGTLLGLLALNAFAGGVYGLSGAAGVPTEWLAGSPFTDYVIPSLILFGIVGGSLATGAVAVLARARSASTVAGAASTILLGWIAVQVAIIGYVSWLQPAVALSALLMLGLSARLARSEEATT